MIKKWNQFNESMAEKPGPNVPGSVKVTMSAEEANSFSDEPALSKLIYDDKVSLLGNDVWYLENDEQTKAILDTYLEMSGETQVGEIKEEFFGGPVSDILLPKLDAVTNKLIDIRSKISKGISDEETKKVEIIYNYLIHDMDLDMLSTQSRRAAELTGRKSPEGFIDKVKRSKRNW